MKRFDLLKRYMHNGGILRKGRTNVLRQAKTVYKEDGKWNSKQRISRSLKVPQVISPQSIRATSKNSHSQMQLAEKPTSSYRPRTKKRNSPRNETNIFEKRRASGHVFSSSPSKSSNKVINEQLIETSDNRVKSNRRVKRGTLVINRIAAERMLLYKDDDIVVLDKPSGLAVHSGPRMKDDLSHYLHYWQYDAPKLPQLAHRLDKDTSGILLLTRHTEAARRLAKMFRERTIIKKYWAITVNVPEAAAGSVKIPLAVKNIATDTGHKRRSMNRVVLRIDKMDEFSQTTSGRTLFGGVQMALTEYRVLSVSQLAPRRCCLMEVKPVTGFKHQIRVHLADGLMCPILGDHKFAGPLFRSSSFLKMKVKALNCFKTPLHLHAREVIIPNYFINKGKPLIVKATPPGHFVRTAKMQGLNI